MEQALAEELQQIAVRPEVAQLTPFQVTQTFAGGVQFSGEPSSAYAVNLHSRIANRVLMQLRHQRYSNEQDIYNAAHTLSWEKYFDPTCTFRIDLTAHQSPLNSLNFAALRIKDAVCDRFRAHYGERPSVDTSNPDMRIYAHLSAQDITLYLDTSGEPLFKRGWRLDKGAAPIKENLAAGILRLSGWQAGQALFDPMCGSGTFLIEAAQMVLGIPAGSRRSFAFEKNKLFKLKTWQSLCAQALAQVNLGLSLKNISGSDISGDMLTLARANWERAGLPGMVELKQLDARFIQPPTSAPGVMLLNPPYGERIAVRGKKTDFIDQQIDDEAQQVSESLSNEFASAFAKSLKQSFAGWEVYVLSGDLQLPRRMRLKESRRIPLFNGPIECRLFRFTMVAGSAR